MTDKNKQKNIWISLAILFAAYVVIFLLVWLFNISQFKGENVTQKSITYAGLLIMTFLGMAYYSLMSSKKVLMQIRKCGALAVTMVLSYAIMEIFAELLNLYYLIPYSICALLGATLIDSRTSFFANINLVVIFFASLLLFGEVNSADLYFVLFAGLFSSILSAYSTTPNMIRTKYILIGLVLGISSTLFALTTYLMFNVVFVAKQFFINVGTAFTSGFFTIMLLFLFMPLLEKIFGLVTNFKLNELTSTNQPLLKRLLTEAPGTFNHSLTVSNYVEACASAIGANPIVARAVAYFHDVGKLKNPLYFVENQSGVNPHDELTPEASVLAIKKHVLYGYTLAKEYDLPQEICQGILEHHGTMPIKYFYLKAKKLTDGELPYDSYSYEGPKPSTKISAILMICDACEAALRASGDKNNASLIVNKVVQERMEFEQFNECDISMQEIEIVKSTILTTYLGFKHKRIAYPDVKM
ncbi:MAG: HDIG domain-containing protein [Clostridia bacterium]